MMRPIETPKKRRWTRVLAIVLLICCVLAALPTWILGQWLMPGGGHANAEGNTPVTKPEGTAHSVNYKFFTYVKREAETYEKPGEDIITYYNANGEASSEKIAFTPANWTAETSKTITNKDCDYGGGLFGIGKCDNTITITLPAYKYERIGKTFPAITYTMKQDTVNSILIGNVNLGTMAKGETKVIEVNHTSNDNMDASSEAGVDGAALKYTLEITRDNISCTHSRKTYEKTWQFTYQVTDIQIVSWTAKSTPPTTVTTEARNENVFLSSTDTGEILHTQASNFISYSSLYAGDSIPRVSYSDLVNAKASIKTLDGSVPFELNYVAGFFKAKEDGSPDTVPFDFSSPMGDNDTTVWVEWTSERKGANTSLTNMLKNNTHTNIITGVGTTFTDSVNAQGIYQHNLTNDTGYGLFGNTVSLGDSNTASTTLSSGSTLKFCLNRGVSNIDAAFDADISGNAAANEKDPNWSALADYFVSLDYYSKDDDKSKNTFVKGANPLEYTVVLQNDLRISGTLEIGGYTGAYGNATMGHIIGAYVKLDMNGHDIIVEKGGMLQSYGLITDSVGTGTIYVEPGGTLASQFVLYDVNGGNQTVWRYIKGSSPFELYSFPYLRTNVEILVNQKANGNTASGAGSFCAFTKLNLGDLAFRSTYIDFIGAGNNYFFRIDVENSKTPGKLRVETYKIPNASFSESVKAQCLDYKNRFILDGIVVELDDSKIGCHISMYDVIDMDVEIEFKRLTFPISSLLDISILNRSTFVLSQELQLHPGCTMTVDSSSSLVLDFENNKEFEKIEKVINIVITKYTAYFPGETKDMAGAIFATNTHLGDQSQYVHTGDYTFSSYLNQSGYASYWNMFGPAKLNIYGTLKLVGSDSTGAVPEGTYSLAGNVTVNRVEIVKRNANGGYENDDSNPNDGIDTFAWNAQNLTVANFKNSTGKTVNFRTYNMQIVPGKFYWFGKGNLSLTDALAKLKPENTMAYASAVKYLAAPVCTGNTAYLFDTTNANYHTAITGTYDIGTGLMKSGNTYYAFQKTTNQMLAGDSSAADYQNHVVDYAMTVWELPESAVDTEKKTVTYGGTTYVYFAGLYQPASALDLSAGTATVNMQAYTSVTGKYTAMKLAYVSNGKYWKLTAAG